MTIGSTEQQTLLFRQEGETSIHLIDVPVAQCRHSRFNTRKTRSDKDISRLAERISRQGFERTRALWAIEVVDGYYEVFAGGTRLEASKVAGLDVVPILLHVGYSEDDVSRRADVDNENDEYHAKVPLPDEWAECLRLKNEEGWIQQRIADAKQCDHREIGRKQDYAQFPQNVLNIFGKKDFLRESHAAELAQLGNFPNLEPWLTRNESMIEILQRVVVGPDATHRGGSEGKSPTAEVFRKHVDAYNTMIQTAESAIKGFPEQVDDNGQPYIPRNAFLALLSQKNVRVTKDVIAAAGTITQALQGIEHRRIRQIEAEQRRLTEEQASAEQESLRLEIERQQQAKLEHLLSSLQLGDCRTLIPEHCPNHIQLVLTDPPYGKNFQSNRRVVTEKKQVIDGDQSVEHAAALFSEVLALLKPKLSTDAHLFVFTHQDSYEAFCSVIRQTGLTLRRTMTWLKGNHGMGDVTRGEALTETEWIIHAVQGNPKLTDNIDRSELLDFPGEQNTEHPNEKPLALLRHLVQRGSEQGQVVVDPFAGTANSLLAIMAESRQGWACEIEEQYYRIGSDQLYRFATGELDG